MEILAGIGVILVAAFLLYKGNEALKSAPYWKKYQPAIVIVVMAIMLFAIIATLIKIT